MGFVNMGIWRYCTLGTYGWRYEWLIYEDTMALFEAWTMLDSCEVWLACSGIAKCSKDKFDLFTLIRKWSLTLVYYHRVVLHLHPPEVGKAEEWSLTTIIPSILPENGFKCLSLPRGRKASPTSCKIVLQSQAPFNLTVSSKRQLSKFWICHVDAMKIR